MYETALSEERKGFTRRVLTALNREGVNYMVGGAAAIYYYTGVWRDTKDLDVFVLPQDSRWALDTLAVNAIKVTVVEPHWLAKAMQGDNFADIIHGSGNGVLQVDEEWFRRSRQSSLLGIPVRVVGPEETIWMKAFVAERARYDGADIARMLYSTGKSLDWQRLLALAGEHWELLLSYLVMYEYVFPSDSDRVPAWVMQSLLEKQLTKLNQPPLPGKVCRGPLLDMFAYTHYIRDLGYDVGQTAQKGQTDTGQQGIGDYTLEAA